MPVALEQSPSYQFMSLGTGFIMRYFEMLYIAPYRARLEEYFDADVDWRRQRSQKLRGIQIWTVSQIHLPTAVGGSVSRGHRRRDGIAPEMPNQVLWFGGWMTNAYVRRRTQKMLTALVTNDRVFKRRPSFVVCCTRQQHPELSELILSSPNTAYRLLSVLPILPPRRLKQ